MIIQIKKILVEEGGKLVNYLSDVVSHLISENPDHPDVTEALEIFEKPVVTVSKCSDRRNLMIIKCIIQTKWVRMSLESATLLP